jgi:type II secretion system protein J
MSRVPRAFTLLELLLAIAITAILAATVYASLMVATHTRDRAAEAVGKDRALTLALDLIRRDLQSAPPPTGTMAGAFIGEDDNTFDTVSFTTTNTYLPPDGRLSDLINVSLLLLDDQDSDDSRSMMLVREVTTNLLSATTTEPQVQVLARGITGIDLAYSDGADWLDDWDSTQHDNTLPLAVKVTLYHPAESKAEYDREETQTALIVMLPAGTRGDSIFSGSSGR